MAKEFRDGEGSGLHSHPRAQLLYCVSGIMEVAAGRSVWIVPPQRAVWLPPDVSHEMWCRGAVSMRTVYVRPDAVPSDFPETPAIVRVSALLRELILRAVEMPYLYDEAGHGGLIAQLLLKEFTWESGSLLEMQRPVDKRLDHICTQLLNHPANNLTIEQWAQKLNVSSKTLARLISAETGASFTTWRQQIRLLSALPRLAAGTPIIEVALDVGYDTPGAFSAMFRRFTGMTPRAYFRTMQQP